MTYIPFNPTMYFTYKIYQTIGRDRWSWEVGSDTTIEEFKEIFDGLNDVPKCSFEVVKLQNGQYHFLTLKRDRKLMQFVKDYNEAISPSWYVVIAFDRETGRGNWSEGVYPNLYEAKWRIEEIQAREGEKAPILEVNHQDGKWDMHYQFLDEIDREIVEGWGITGN